MATKKGGMPRQTCGKPHGSAEERKARPPACALLTGALRTEAERERGAVKRLMRWTGASERAVKAWLGAESLPRADHLIALMAHSDEVCRAVLRAAGRAGAVAAADVMAARALLAAAIDRLSCAAGPEGMPTSPCRDSGTPCEPP